MILLLGCFKLLLCFSAFMVLASQNPVHSVLFLVLVFCNGAGILLLLGFEFLAMIFLVVYVGAIAVLFLFVVMMLNLKLPGFRQSLLNHYPVSLFVLLLFFGEFTYYLSGLAVGLGSPTFLADFYQNWGSHLAGLSNVHLLGSLLYTYYYLAFLLSGFILLVAMVSSIFLTLGTSSGRVPSLGQDVYGQVVRSNVVRLSGAAPSPSLGE
jgi:NADH-quinone oxidoreductase subunit J